MTPSDAKPDIKRYLQIAREALLWKLEGLSEYDVRRPLVPTGTNLLGLVKHLAGVELGYFGNTFGRPVDDPPAWLADAAEPNVDMWATASESRQQIVALYRRAAGHADVVRELIDGAVGLRATVSNLPSQDGAWWDAYRGRLEDVARQVGGR